MKTDLFFSPKSSFSHNYFVNNKQLYQYNNIEIK